MSSRQTINKQNRLTLGVYCSGMPSSAAIVKDGRIIGAVQEERLTREYRARTYPHNAMQYCLGEVGAQIEDLDAIAIGWNPGLNVSERCKGGFSERPPTPMSWLFSIPNQVLPQYAKGNSLETRQSFVMDTGKTIDFHYVYHYLAHAANAYYMSSFQDCAVFCADAYGEIESTVWLTVEGGEFKVLKSKQFPQSIGAFYSAITEFLGFTPYKDEWKMMGLSAYGNGSKYKKQIESLIYPLADGSFELDLNYFNFYNFDTKGFVSKKLEEKLGPPMTTGEPIGSRHADIAAATQTVLEEVLLHCLRSFHKAYPTDFLCLSGGVFMNSLFNGKVSKETPYKSIYISHSPDDSGTSIGAALYSQLSGTTLAADAQTTGNPYLGPSWSNEEIKSKLNGYRITYTTVDPVTTGARLLADDKIIGWFQGRLEFGQRALGNRSILANPARADMKDRINSAVKFREEFRPFAPSVLAKETGRYFEWNNEVCPFMERVLPVRPEMMDAIPAVTHEDGTGRVQMVDSDWNPEYHNLIEAFAEITGIHVVLNTSFNLNGEPIVCSPEDAIKTFYNSGIDALIIDNCLVEK